MANSSSRTPPDRHGPQTTCLADAGPRRYVRARPGRAFLGRHGRSPRRASRPTRRGMMVVVEREYPYRGRAPAFVLAVVWGAALAGLYWAATDKGPIRGRD